MINRFRLAWLPLIFLLATVAAVKAGDYYYTTNSDNTLTISAYTGPGGVIVIPSAIDGKTVTIIGDGAFCSGPFNHNTSLASVTIPDSVTSIGGLAFGACISLMSVTIPRNVTNIGSLAFENCNSLTSVTIPDSVTIIGNGAFSDCTNLTSITVGIGNSVYSSTDGVLFKSQTTLIQYPGGKAGNYAIPNGVSDIGNSAFFDCPSLTSVMIGNSVTSILGGAFSYCTGLTSVTIGNGVTSIGGSAFSDCISLTSVTIPNDVTSIGIGAFAECYSLTSVTIGNGVTSIGDEAFSSYGLMMRVYFEGNAPSIGSNVFDDDTIIYYLLWTTGWSPTFGGCPTMPWIPLITANDRVGNVNLNSGDPVTIAVQTMNVGRYSGVDVDWWVLARAGSSWFYLNRSGQWTQFDWALSYCHPVHQGPLFNLPATQVLNTTDLQVGSYTFWFVISYPMDGILNLGGQILVHSVNVTVQ